MPRILLEHWFDGRVRIKSAESRNGFDWALPVFREGTSYWFLDTAHASNNRIIDQFYNLMDRNSLSAGAALTVLRNHVLALFQEHPSSNILQLSRSWGSGVSVRNYHSQHYTHLVAQNGGFNLSATLDAVTAAFGGFSFFAVPIGTAVKENAHNYRVTINSVAVHVVDSYDFNGYQPLGCWALPDRIRRTYYPNYQCVNNASFRYYRNMKARGQDYNVFMSPITLPLTTPIIFRFSN